jgi:hypothetical protein
MRWRMHVGDDAMVDSGEDRAAGRYLNRREAVERLDEGR